MDEREILNEVVENANYAKTIATDAKKIVEDISKAIPSAVDSCNDSLGVLETILENTAEEIRNHTVYFESPDEISLSVFPYYPKYIAEYAIEIAIANLDDLYNCYPPPDVPTGRQYYDSQWDQFQDNGNRTDYQGLQHTSKGDYPKDYSFAGWTSPGIIPKYPLTPTNAYGMFWHCPNLKIPPEIDFNVCTKITAMFSGCRNLARVKSLDCPVATSAGWVFDDCSNLEYIGYINIPNAKLWTATFNKCRKLKEIRFGEKSIKGDLPMAYSTELSVESIKSIVMGLSTSVTGKTLTITNEAYDRFNAANPDLIDKANPNAKPLDVYMNTHRPKWRLSHYTNY